MRTRLSNYDTTFEFKCFAEDFYESFNTRQIHYILETTFQEELNMELFEKRKIIIDRFPLHEKLEIREAVSTSWKKYRWRILGGLYTANWQN